MGQQKSLLKKGKKSKPSSVQSIPSTDVPNATKFPLHVESHLLRQIKDQYHHQGQDVGKSCDNDDRKLSQSDLQKEGDGENSSYKALEQAVLKHICKLDNSLIEPSAEAADYFQNKPCSAVCLEDELAPETPTEKKGFLITDLPFLVVQELIEYLNPQAILALRATCVTTKSWIDSNAHILRDIELRIEPEGEDTSYFCPPSSAPWSNFAIPYVQLHSAFIQDTIYNYCDLIWRLEIFAPKPIGCNISTAYSSVHPRCIFGLINQCPYLEHLSICRLDTLTILGDQGQYERLRVLSIDRLQWMNNADFHMFENLIMKCPHLEYLKIPEYEILGSLAFNFYDVNVSPEKEYLVRPLIRYLDHYRRRNCDGKGGIISRSKKLYIDVLEFEDFKLCSSEIFYELSRKCVACNAVLMNVYFVPRDAVLRNQQDIVEAFASMFGFIKIDFQAELWKNLEVMECWIEDYPDDFELIRIRRQLSFLRTISRIKTLRSLTIRLSIDDPDICSQTLAACVGESYTGIQKLILRRHQANPDSYVRIPIGFGNAFSSVKYLYFQELDARNGDFRGLWESLHNLEELFVYKCPYFTQDAFLDSSEDENNKPPILKLTKLQVLVIFLYEGVGMGFNDEFLLQALRYMKLRGFALRGAAGVEFTDKGMLSLLNSPFHDAIEDFEAPSTYFRPSLSPHYWNFYIALPKKELRRNRIWLSCSVLLNSLSSRKHPYDFKLKCLGL